MTLDGSRHARTTEPSESVDSRGSGLRVPSAWLGVLGELLAYLRTLIDNQPPGEENADVVEQVLALINVNSLLQ